MVNQAVDQVAFPAPVLNLMQDPTSAYFLHPGENPGVLIVSSLLTESNYNVWSRSMIVALDAKNKLSFIDGSLPQPNINDPLRAAWDRSNKVVLAWLVRALSPEISQSIMFITKAFDLWCELKTRFQQNNHSRIADLNVELYSMKQGNVSITAYFTQLKAIWGELENLRPINLRVCGLQCMCKTYRDQDCVMSFLKGLNDQYSGVRSQLLLMSPLPSLNQAYSLALQQERQFAHENGEVTRILAVNNNPNTNMKAGNAAKPRYVKGNYQNNRKYGTHCGRPGHTIDACWQKHGKPPNFQNRPIINLASSDECDLEDQQGAMPEQNSNFSLTREQYEGLMALLQNSQSQHSSISAFNHENHASNSILIYIDDMLLTGNNASEIVRIKHQLDHLFKIKDLGPLRFFLGLEVGCSSRGISVCQRKYTLELLDTAGLLACKPTPTPMHHTVKLIKDDGHPFTDHASYRRLIGQLLYLTNTRPDICFAVTYLSQFLSNPMVAHHSAALRVLRYLKGSPGHGLFFPRTSTLQLKAFSDSDWAACPESRRSITGFCVFLGDSLISWKSKKQPTVSRSSSEAESRALAATTCELQWLSFLLHDLNLPPLAPALIYCGNRSAMQIAANPVFHERTKHIELDCHVVREKVKSSFLRLLPIRSTLQVADLCTKPLPPPQFSLLFSKLGMLNIHAQLAGGS